MPRLWLSSRLFSHHISHSTANTMTYYVFQLDSPQYLHLRSFTAPDLWSRLLIFHFNRWRISSKCLAGCQQRAGGTTVERGRAGEIWIWIMLLFATVNNIHHDKNMNICLIRLPSEGVAMNYIILTGPYSPCSNFTWPLENSIVSWMFSCSVLFKGRGKGQHCEKAFSDK